MLLTQLQQLEHRLVAKLEEFVEMMRAASTSLPPPPALARQQAMCSEDDDAMTEVLTQELPAYDDDADAHDEEEKCPNQNGEEEYKRCDVELPRPKRQRFQTSHFMFHAE